MPTWVSVILAALTTLAVLALLWIGGELHRQSCLKDHATYVTGSFTLPSKATANRGVVNVQVNRSAGTCSRKPW